MGNTPSFHDTRGNDAFGRPGSPAAGPHALAPDRFKPKADRDAVRKGGKPADAFAGKGPAKGAAAANFYNPFDDRPRAAAMQPAHEPEGVKPEKVKAEKVKPEKIRPEKIKPERVKPERVKAPKAQRTLANGAALQVVASQPEIMPVERVERGEVRRAKPAAKASSLVLVSAGSAMTASAEPAAVTGGPGDLTMPRIDPPSQKPAPKSGGGGGGGGNSGGRSVDARPLRDRVFNQDDLAGVLIVIAMLLLLALYLFRGGGAAPAPVDNSIVQVAAVTPPAPAKPLADPFGDQPVDLTPKSPAPPEAAVAPPPVVAAKDITMHAWFCTAKSGLTPQTMAALDKQLVSWKSELATRELVVAGYADTRGASDYNVSLGTARATTVADYLKSKGVKVADASGVGELDGLADNENCSNQRRVDVHLSGAPEEPSRSCAPPKEAEELACA